jgi:hypothetical protein
MLACVATGCAEDRLTPDHAMQAPTADAFAGTFSGTAKPLAMLKHKESDTHPPAGWDAPKRALTVLSDSRDYDAVIPAGGNDPGFSLSVRPGFLTITTADGQRIVSPCTFRKGRLDVDAVNFFHPWLPFIAWGDRSTTVYLDDAGDLLIDRNWNQTITLFLLLTADHANDMNVQFIIQRQDRGPVSSATAAGLR